MSFGNKPQASSTMRFGGCETKLKNWIKKKKS